MRKYAAAAVLVMLVACHRAKVPHEQFLLRIDRPWQTPAALAVSGICVAGVEVAAGENDGEYFELHFHLIEQNEETLYISENLPRASAIGKWVQKGETIEVTRRKVSRADVTTFLCTPLMFHISGYSVTGNAGGKGDGMYAPVTRLVAPDFQSYLKEARESPFNCPGVKE